MHRLYLMYTHKMNHIEFYINSIQNRFYKKGIKKYIFCNNYLDLFIPSLFQKFHIAIGVAASLLIEA